MKKTTILSTIVATSAAVVAYLFTDETRRNELNRQFSKMKRKLSQPNDFPIEKAGKPEMGNLENADMVSEGSQFGVQYYNEMKANRKQEQKS